MKRLGKAIFRVFTGPHWQWFALGAVVSVLMAWIIDWSITTILSGYGGWIIGGIIVQYAAIGVEGDRS